MIQCLTPPVSVSSCSSIRCTSSSADSSCGASFGQVALQRAELVGHRVARAAQALDLGLDVALGDEVVRDVDAARRHQHGAADRDAARDRQAEDWKLMDRC